MLVSRPLLRAAIEHQLGVEIKVGLGMTRVIPTTFAGKTDAAIAISMVAAWVIGAAAVLVRLDFIAERHAGVGGDF